MTKLYFYPTSKMNARISETIIQGKHIVIDGITFEQLTKRPNNRVFNYRPLPAVITIGKSSLHGLGLIAVEAIPASSNLGTTHHNVKDELIRTPLGGFINHSDNPNCFIDQNYKLLTIKPIQKGDELTVYYRLTQ